MSQFKGSMKIAWAKQVSMTGGTGDLILESIVEDKTIRVTLTHQAVILHRVDACKRAAEAKIVKSLRNARLPQQVEVTEADFNEL